MSRNYFVYIITNFNNTAFYIGVCNDIVRRMHEHKNGLVDGFSKAYKLRKLVYLEVYQDVKEAISREKQLKNWHRNWKVNLIRQTNPELRDLGR